jgi:tetratricopeptide (TPR) repeat protein
LEPKWSHNQYGNKAFSLIDRVSSEGERLGISLNYYSATGQSDKNEEIARQIVPAYPRDAGPHNLLGNIYFGAGEFKKALQESREVLRLSHMPSAVPYGNLIYAYTLLGRYEEAKVAARGITAETIDAPYVHERLLALAYTPADQKAALKGIECFAGEPRQSASFALKAQNAYAWGQRPKAKELYHRARELWQRGNVASAATALVTDAACDAVLGNSEAIHAATEAAAFPYRNRDFSQPAALGLALCGQAQAQRIADKISKQFPVDTLCNAVKLPAIHAAVELEHDNPAKAIESLQSASPYERAYPYVMYLRGLANLRAQATKRALTSGKSWTTKLLIGLCSLARHITHSPTWA